VPISRTRYVFADAASAIIFSLIVAAAAYWLIYGVVGELDVLPEVDNSGVFTLQQWMERYMRTTFLISCALASVIFVWAVLGSAVWRGREGDGRMTWTLLCALAVAGAALVSYLRLPPTDSGAHWAIALHAAVTAISVWIGTLFAAPSNFRYTPVGGRALRSWMLR
jgi:hypothetical protein